MAQIKQRNYDNSITSLCRERKPLITVGLDVVLSRRTDGVKSYHFISLSGGNERPVLGESLLFHPHPPRTGRIQRLLHHIAVVLVVGRRLVLSSDPVVLRVLLQRTGRILGRCWSSK